MNVFYNKNENRYDEKKRLIKQIDVGVVLDEDFPSEIVRKTTVQQYKHILVNFLNDKNNQIKRTFSYDKSRITFLLIFINLIIFIMFELIGGSMFIDTLVNYVSKS